MRESVFERVCERERETQARTISSKRSKVSWKPNKPIAMSSARNVRSTHRVSDGKREREREGERERERE